MLHGQFFQQTLLKKLNVDIAFLGPEFPFGRVGELQTRKIETNDVVEYEVLGSLVVGEVTQEDRGSGARVHYGDARGKRGKDIWVNEAGAGDLVAVVLDSQAADGRVHNFNDAS